MKTACIVKGVRWEALQFSSIEKDVRHLGGRAGTAAWFVAILAQERLARIVLKSDSALLWLAQRANACEMGCSGQAYDAGSKAKTVASGAAVLATTCWQWADGSKCPHQLWDTRHLCVW